MSSVPKIGAQVGNTTNLADTTQIVKYLPDDVICECSKYINKLCDIRTLSLLSKHFFLVVFNDKFPRWQTLLTSHFPSSFQLTLPIPQPIACYQRLKAIDTSLRAGTYETRNCDGHQDKVNCLKVKDGMLISASDDRTIKIWDLASGELIRSLDGHQGDVTCLEVNDGMLISGSLDGTIKIWDIATGQELHSLDSYQDSIQYLEVKDDTLISVSYNGTIKTWNLVNVQEIHSFTTHQDGINCLKVKDGMLICGLSDSTIKIWDIASGELQRTLVGHEGQVYHLTATDELIISSSSDTINIWDIASGKLLHSLTGHKDSVTCLEVNDGMLFSGSFDRTIKIWDIATGQELRRLPGPVGSASKCLRVKDGMLISGSVRGPIRIWDIATGQELHCLTGHLKAIKSLEVKDGMLISGSEDGTIKIWDFTPAMPLVHFFNRGKDPIFIDQAMNSCASYQCQSSIACFYQSIFLQEEQAVLAKKFAQLPQEMQNEILSSLGPDFQENLYENRAQFTAALITTFKEQFKEFSTDQKKFIYTLVWELAGKPPGDENWGEIHAADNILRLIDAFVIEAAVSAYKDLSEDQKKLVHFHIWNLSGQPLEEDNWDESHLLDDKARFLQAFELAIEDV